jgi:hypothetical protein
MIFLTRPEQIDERAFSIRLDRRHDEQEIGDIFECSQSVFD